MVEADQKRSWGSSSGWLTDGKRRRGARGDGDLELSPGDLPQVRALRVPQRSLHRVRLLCDGQGQAGYRGLSDGALAFPARPARGVLCTQEEVRELHTAREGQKALWWVQDRQA